MGFTVRFSKGNDVLGDGTVSWVASVVAGQSLATYTGWFRTRHPKAIKDKVVRETMFLTELFDEAQTIDGCLPDCTIEELSAKAVENGEDPIEDLGDPRVGLHTFWANLTESEMEELTEVAGVI